MEPNQEFPYWKRNLVLAWISQFFVLAGFAAAMTFIPLFFQDHLGIESENERGIYVSMFNFFGVLGYAVFCPLWGSLSDRFGVKIMLLRGSFVTAIFFPMMAFVTAPWQLITLRLVTAALAGTTAACHILLAKGTPDDKQGFAQGSLTAAVCAGSLVGNMVGGFFVDFYGYTFTFVACGVLYVLSGIFCLFMKEKKIVRVQGESAYVKKIRNYRKSPMPQFTIGVWLMLLLYSLSSLVGYLSVPYVAMMIELIDTTGHPAYWTGIICSISSVCALFSGLIFGYLADHVKPKYLIIPVLSVIGLCLIIRGVADSLFVFGLFSACTIESENPGGGDSAPETRCGIRLVRHVFQQRQYAVHGDFRLDRVHVRDEIHIHHFGDLYVPDDPDHHVYLLPDHAPAVLPCTRREGFQ